MVGEIGSQQSTVIQVYGNSSSSIYTHVGQDDVGDAMLCSQKLSSVFLSSYLISAESASCHIVSLDEQLELFW